MSGNRHEFAPPIRAKQPARDRRHRVELGSSRCLRRFEPLAAARFSTRNRCARSARALQPPAVSPRPGVEKALAALRRFRVLSEIMGVPVLHVLATAAARDASNGGEFLTAAAEAIGAPVDASIGHPGGGAFRPWGHRRHQPPGWRRRRSRRRFARIDRRERRAFGQGHEPATWRSHPDGRIEAVATRGGQDCPRGIGRVAHRRASRADARSTRSAEPGGRSPSCI